MDQWSQAPVSMIHGIMPPCRRCGGSDDALARRHSFGRQEETRSPMPRVPWDDVIGQRSSRMRGANEVIEACILCAKPRRTFPLQLPIAVAERTCPSL